MSGFDKGYRAGTEGMAKAIDTALLVGVIQERKRIIELLEGFDPRTAIGDLLPLLIKGENK